MGVGCLLHVNIEHFPILIAIQILLMCERTVPETVWDPSKGEIGDQVNRTEHLGWINEAKRFRPIFGTYESDSRELEAVNPKRSIWVHIKPPNEQEV